MCEWLRPVYAPLTCGDFATALGVTTLLMLAAVAAINWFTK